MGGEGGGRPPASSAATARELGITDAVFAHLGGRHGSETAEVLGLCTGRRELARRLHPALPYLEAEVVWAARREMALTVTDVLARRTRALILDRTAAVEAAPRVAALLAAELGLDPAEQQRQVTEFVELVEGELASEGVTGPRPAVSQ